MTEADAQAATPDVNVADIVKRLVQIRLRCQPVVALVGSGISAPTAMPPSPPDQGVPLIDQIISKATAEFSNPDQRDSDLLKRHPELKTEGGLRALLQKDAEPVLRDSKTWHGRIIPWLREQEANTAPQEQHRALMSLLCSNLLRAIVTPNWDCLLERAVEDMVSQVPSSQRSPLSVLFEIIRSPEDLSAWTQKPQSIPALIKLHGDLRELECSRGHTTVSRETPAREDVDLERRCPICGQPVKARFLLPDSARRLSREMIRLLRPAPPKADVIDGPTERLDRLGAILVVGFSADYDKHLQELIMHWGSSGCLVIVMRRSNKQAFGLLPELEILPGNIRETLPTLAKLWATETNKIEERTKARDWLEVSFSADHEPYDALFGRIPVTAVESQILRHPDFGRLRHIKQLGQKRRFYTSADHSRFEHSVASLRVIDDLYTGLAQAVERERVQHSPPPAWLRHYAPTAATHLTGYWPSSQERRLVRLATLFHDFGHIWFSHLGEAVLDELVPRDAQNQAAAPVGLRSILEKASYRHEGLVKQFLRYLHDKPTAPSPSLLSILTEEVERLGQSAGITSEDFFELLAGSSRLGHLNSLVASSIDADKLEYLYRDSARTGRGGAHAIRAESVASGFEITEFGRTTIQLEAVSVVERVAAARYLMFQSVYFDDRVRALEESLVGVLVDYCREELGPNEPDVYNTLLLTESEILDKIALRTREAGGRPLRYKYWSRVLTLVDGKGDFPEMKVWILYPCRQIREMPGSVAVGEVRHAATSLHKDLAELFYERYQCNAVFALYRFQIHRGPEEIPISGGHALYSPRDVSPLIAGLQDVRQTPIRLCVLFYGGSDIRYGCEEEIKVILERHSHQFEVRAVREVNGQQSAVSSD
jgi:HD superfamily phosphohydrolase